MASKYLLRRQVVKNIASQRVLLITPSDASDIHGIGMIVSRYAATAR